MIKKFWKKEKTSSAKQLFGSRGDERIKNGDYNGAVMMYDEALKCEPTDTTLLLSRSLAQMMLTPPNLHLALQDADAAIQHCPTSWQGWLQKGETHLRMGNIKAAEAALMNAVGFAQGMDKLAAQRSLADIQSRRSKGSPVAGPSGTSVQSTSPTPFPEPSLHTAPRSESSPTTTPSHIPCNTQTSSMTNPTHTVPSSVPTAPANTQSLGKSTPIRY
jgi:hypothetical protein